VKWLNFPLVRNARWYGDGIVLLGDALHTAHFSIGSGTKLAVEDAIVLAGAFADAPAPAEALPLFEARRRPRVEQYQQAAMDSLRWFENMGHYTHLAPVPFALEAMTRSKRVDFEKLRQRDPAFAAQVETWRGMHGEPVRVLEPEERDADAG
jgi:anthraniloyl-CoA monooxygenase